MPSISKTASEFVVKNKIRKRITASLIMFFCGMEVRKGFLLKKKLAKMLHLSNYCVCLQCLYRLKRVLKALFAVKVEGLQRS